MKHVILARYLRTALIRYPELIDDSLLGIRPGGELLGDDHPALKEHDVLPNGRQADIVFVEEERITVVETKQDSLYVSLEEAKEDDVELIVDYLGQVRIKYPNRALYRGFLVGTGILDREKMEKKLSLFGEDVKPLVFGKHIPATIKFCRPCRRAVDYCRPMCVCGSGSFE